jgi:hypothetical protein
MNTNTIFNIYTTGIVNSAEFEDDGQNLIKKWNNGVCKNIINNIPLCYNIKIHHYDPFLSSNRHTKKMTIAYVMTNLIPQDIESSRRVIQSDFYNTPFNASCVQNPHLVFDMAHIYSFSGQHNTDQVVGMVSIAGNYGEPKSDLIKLHVLRTGFIGNSSIAFNLAISDSFRIKKNGDVITFVDRMIEKNYYNSELQYEPSDFIDKIMTQSKTLIENMIIDHTGKKYFELSDIFTSILTTETSFHMLRLFLIGFWKDVDINLLIIDIAECIYKKYYIK